MKINPVKRKGSLVAKTGAAQRNSAISARSLRTSDRVVQLLAEYESKPKGSEERFQAFLNVLKAVHDEPHGK